MVLSPDRRPRAAGLVPLPRLSGVSVLFALVLLTVGVGWLRNRHLDLFLPQQHEPDPYCIWQAEFLTAREAGTAQELADFYQPGNERLFYYYPLHIARLWRLQAAPATVQEPLEASTLDAHLAAASASILRGRRWSAWLSALLVPGVFFLARRFLDPWPALLAAALAGTSLQHLIASEQARPHAIATSASAWALWGATVLRRHCAWPGLLGGALLVALGVCALHSGAVLAGAALAAFVLRDRKGGWRDAARWAALPLLVLAIYAWLSPGILLPPAEGSQQSYRGFRIEDGAFIGLGHRIELSLFAFQKPWRTLQWLWGYDPAHLVLGLLGLALLPALRRPTDAGRRRDAWVVAAHAAPYALILASYAKTFDRYTLQLLPALSVLGAWAVARLVAWVPQGLPRRVASIGLPIAALALPVLGQAARHRLRAQADTYEQASAWLEQRAREGSPRPAIAAGPGIVLPIPYDRASLASALSAWGQNPWLHYQSRLGEALAAPAGWSVATLSLTGPEAARALADPEAGGAWLRGWGAQYVVLENSQRTQAIRPAFQRLRATLRAEGRRVARFLPRADPQLPFLDFGDSPEMLPRTLDQERLGPPIEIWELSPR